MTIKTNLFDPLPDATLEEQFTSLFENKHVKIERIVSFGQTSNEDFWYDQVQDEWVIVLEGFAIVEVMEEGHVKAHRLGKGDSLYIPAHRKHRVSYTEENQNTIWLAIHF